MSQEQLSENHQAEPQTQKPIAVEVNNITVSYRSYKERPTSLKESIVRFIKTGNMTYHSTFDALSNVSFCVRKGEVLGVIGSNGAGKSTLLRTLAGVLKPRIGSVNIQGSIDSLIQLGAGFDSELNAIENIYLNASLHKISRSVIAERVDRIIEFAELKEFANTPIKYYSSGMNARLGFATAIDKDPDVLLVDEVLGVGDERFKKKCDVVFDNFLSRDKTVIIVSHNLSAIERMAHQAVLLSKGRAVFIGDPKEAIARYQDKTYQTALGA